MNNKTRTRLLVPALLLIASSAFAQSERGWVDVNFGLATSGADEEAFVFTGRLFGEPASLATAYPQPSRGASFDFGGGFMVTPVIGVGVSFTGTAHQDVVGLAVSIPHPYFFNATASASGATDGELTRAEGGVNLQVMIVPLHTPNLRVRVFGGPTFFRYQADMVSDIIYRQVAFPTSRSNLVTVTGFDAVEVEGTGWGAHVGGDVSYFFSRIFGIGGFARFSRGSVSIDEPVSETRADIKVGGVQLGGGLRLRF